MLTSNAYMLHCMDFKNSSAIIDFFTLEHGRIRAIANGCKRPKSKLKAATQSFTELEIAWRGKNELLSLNHVEPLASGQWFKGLHLFSALYMNELILKLLPPHDPYPDLYVSYQQALILLNNNLAKTLRKFEYQLLELIGYGFNFSNIEAEQYYRYHPHDGFTVSLGVNTFFGKDLLTISQLDFDGLSVQRTAKLLFRQAIEYQLNGKPLRTRECLANWRIQHEPNQ